MGTAWSQTEALLAELRAIEAWDNEYEANEVHDRIEQDACQHHRTPLREIIFQISGFSMEQDIKSRSRNATMWPRTASTRQGPDMENRSQPRLELKVTVKVYSTVSGRASGQTLDFSEAGMSAMLLMELKVGELVGLDLELPTESVHLWAIVRNRVAFRYGFEFVRTDPAQMQVKKAYSLFAQGREQIGDTLGRGRGKTKRGA